jgi:hypothetical protein
MGDLQSFDSTTANRMRRQTENDLIASGPWVENAPLNLMRMRVPLCASCFGWGVGFNVFFLPVAEGQARKRLAPVFERRVLFSQRKKAASRLRFQ